MSNPIIDFSNGSIFINGDQLFFTYFYSNKKNPFSKKLETYRIKKTMIIKISDHFQWENFEINSIILEIKNKYEIFSKISFEPTPHPIYSVENHPITVSVEKLLKNFSLKSEKKYEKLYYSDLLTLSINYDPQMLAISLKIKYKNKNKIFLNYLAD